MPLAGLGFVPGFCRYHDADREQITGTGARKPGIPGTLPGWTSGDVPAKVKSSYYVLAGMGGNVKRKVRNAIILFRPLLKIDNIEIRLHGTTLYNSIYRGDAQLLVSTQIYGTMASNAPTFHLRKIPGGDMASTYLESFERVWERATPLEGA